MRQELRWALGATVLLSAAAWLWPQSAPRVVSATEFGPIDGARADGGLLVSSPKEPLPPSLEPLLLEPARRDAFTLMAPVASAVVAAPSTAPQPAPMSLSPQPPAAPFLTLRYLGRMVTPDGLPMVLLARGDAAVAVHAGMMLDEGYRVLRITAEAIRLVYPPTGAEVDIPIPPAPNSP